MSRAKAAKFAVQIPKRSERLPSLWDGSHSFLVPGVRSDDGATARLLCWDAFGIGEQPLAAKNNPKTTQNKAKQAETRGNKDWRGLALGQFENRISNWA